VNFAAQMRIGSLEISAALMAVAAIAVIPRRRIASEIGAIAPMRVRFRAIEFGTPRSFEAVCPIVVGRSAEAGLVLADSEVSRRHARFETERGAVFVRDLQSRNGTFLNGRRLHDAIEVRVGDAIDVGTTRLVVEDISAWT